jgi:hypothetical protein
VTILGASQISNKGRYVVGYDLSANIYIFSDSGATFSFSHKDSNFIGIEQVTSARVFAISNDYKYIPLLVKEVDNKDYLYIATGT